MRAGPSKQPILLVPIRAVMLKVLGAAHSPPKSKPVALVVAERDSRASPVQVTLQQGMRNESLPCLNTELNKSRREGHEIGTEVEISVFATSREVQASLPAVMEKMSAGPWAKRGHFSSL